MRSQDFVKQPGRLEALTPQQKQLALKVRIDFMVFTDFEPSIDFPDATPLYRFRAPLVQAKLDQVQLRRIHSQLERQGL